MKNKTNFPSPMKYFEEKEDEICNFISEFSDNNQTTKDKNINLKDNLTKNTSLNITNASINSKSAQDPRSSKKATTTSSKLSRKNTKTSTEFNTSLYNDHNNSFFGIKNPNSEIFDLIDSLKEKINIYETEIRSLIDEKVQMQLTINNLQLKTFQNSKKSNRNSFDSSMLVKSNESAIEINKHYIEEAKGFKGELSKYRQILERQKGLLDQNFSILNETILEVADENASVINESIPKKEKSFSHCSQNTNNLTQINLKNSENNKINEKVILCLNNFYRKRF